MCISKSQVVKYNNEIFNKVSKSKMKIIRKSMEYKMHMSIKLISFASENRMSTIIVTEFLVY